MIWKTRKGKRSGRPVPARSPKQSPVRCRRWRFCKKNPEYRFGHMWYSGVLVFWYSGLAPRKTRFWDTGTLCTWHVACGGLDFQGKNAGGSWHLAKRSPGPGRQTSAGLSAGLSVQTNPIGRSQSCKTKPILRLRIADCRNDTGQLASAFGGVVGLRIVQTNPISAVAPVESPIAPIFRYSTLAVQCRLCQTKPISARQGDPMGPAPTTVCRPPRRRRNLIDREGPAPYDLPLTIRHL